MREPQDHWHRHQRFVQNTLRGRVDSSASLGYSDDRSGVDARSGEGPILHKDVYTSINQAVP